MEGEDCSSDEEKLDDGSRLLDSRCFNPFRAENDIADGRENPARWAESEDSRLMCGDDTV